MSSAPREDLQQTRPEGVPASDGSRIPPWPLRGTAGGILAAAYVVLTGVGLAMGFALVAAPATLAWADLAVVGAIVETRTPAVDRWVAWASMLSDTYVVIAALVGLTAVFIWTWRRWGEALVLDAALALEASVFLTVSLTVARERPPVEQLQAAPPTASFPSGHAGAATAFYLGLAYLVGRNVSSAPIRILAFTVAVLAVAVVGFSRVYLGMHYLSDVVAGIVYGGMCLIVALWAVRHGIERHGDPGREAV